MEALQDRLDSFKTKRVKQSSNKASSSSVPRKWPHPSTFKATPHELAEAGFYFSPSSEDRDNVTCFICAKELSDWAEDDDPFEVHWRKCQNSCPWAIVRCGIRGDVDDDGNFISTDTRRFPGNRAMEKARLDTFRAHKSWPHDSVKNHGANSKKMAKAGFVYTPQYSGDDTATCFYCDISLSGWDPEDDPLQEHRKREKKSGISCPFFSAHDALTTESSARTPASKSSRSRSRTRSKATEPETESDDELAMSQTLPSRSRKSTKGKSVSNTKTSIAKTPARRSTRSTTSAMTSGGLGTITPKSKAGTSDIEHEESVNEGETRASKSAKRKRKGKEKIQIIEEEEEGVPNGDQANEGMLRPAKSGVDESAVEERLEAPPVASDEPNLESETPVGDPELATYDECDDNQSLFYGPNFIPPTDMVEGTSSELIRDAVPIPLHSSLQSHKLHDLKAPSTPSTSVIPTAVAVSIKEITLMTEEERGITVEQWVRHEIEIQLAQLTRDGESRIMSFGQKGAEVRRRIETL